MLSGRFVNYLIELLLSERPFQGGKHSDYVLLFCCTHRLRQCGLLVLICPLLVWAHSVLYFLSILVIYSFVILADYLVKLVSVETN